MIVIFNRTTKIITITIAITMIIIITIMKN